MATLSEVWIVKLVANDMHMAWQVLIYKFDVFSYLGLLSWGLRVAIAITDSLVGSSLSMKLQKDCSL